MNSNNNTNVQQLIENESERTRVVKPPFFYKNKTYIRPGYVPNQKQVVPVLQVCPLTPSPKYLQIEQEIEETVKEEEEFEQLMNECFEQQQATLLEDEYDFIREISVSLIKG